MTWWWYCGYEFFWPLIILLWWYCMRLRKRANLTRFRGIVETENFRSPDPRRGERWGGGLRHLLSSIAAETPCELSRHSTREVVDQKVQMICRALSRNSRAALPRDWVPSPRIVGTRTIRWGRDHLYGEVQGLQTVCFFLFHFPTNWKFKNIRVCFPCTWP